MGEAQGRRDRGSGSLFLRGNVWWIKYHRHGKPYRESSKSNDEGTAKKLLKHRQAEIETGQFRGLNVDRVRFDELAADLENDYAINQRKSAARNTRRKEHLKGFFSGMRAVEISTDKIRSYVARRQSKGAANATINRELAALKRMFNLAREMTPPKVNQVPYISMLKEAPPRRGFLEHENFLKLRDALPDYLRPVLTMAYYTGMRAGEVLSLRWEQVDLQAKQVRLDPGTTKNDDARTVPLPGDLFHWLTIQMQTRDAKYPDCSWVFFRKGKPIKSFRGSWKTACEKAKQPGLLFHDLRRSGVRNLVRAGVPERVAMAISGHRTRSVFDRYNIVNERDLREAARKLDRYLKFGHSLGTNPPSDEIPARKSRPLSVVN